MAYNYPKFENSDFSEEFFWAYFAWIDTAN